MNSKIINTILLIYAIALCSCGRASGNADQEASAPADSMIDSVEIVVLGNQPPNDIEPDERNIGRVKIHEGHYVHFQIRTVNGDNLKIISTTASAPDTRIDMSWDTLYAQLSIGARIMFTPDTLGDFKRTVKIHFRNVIKPKILTFYGTVVE